MITKLNLTHFHFTPYQTVEFFPFDLYRVVDSLVEESMLWVDNQDPSGEIMYYFPSML